jgi:alcohol dehydrogenase
MKAAVIEQVGAIENLKIVDRPDPKPGPGEVVARMRAASLNYRDLVTIMGGYGSQQQKIDLIPLSDGAGDVIDVGAGVTQWKVGDRVVGCFFPDWHSGPVNEAKMSRALGGSAPGVASEYRVFGAESILRVPDYLSFTEAASLPCAALTAWVATVTHAGVGPGQIVLTQGTGGVSLFALQFARMAGAAVIATTSTDARLDRLRNLGATHVINYKQDEAWGQTARKISGAGVDLVVEVGGGSTMSQSFRALRRGGTIGVIGVVAGTKLDLPVMALILKNVRMLGVSVGNRDQFATMLAAMAHHQTRPVIDRTFPLADIRAAFEHLQAGRHVGKVCIDI